MNKLVYRSECCGTVEISSVISRRGVPFPFADKEDHTVHNEFKVTVKTDNGRQSFKYYMSMADYEKGIVVMSKEDMLQALASFTEDATTAKMSFKEFCSDLGYDQDSIAARKTYKTCQMSLEKAEKLFGNADLGTVIDSFEEPEEEKKESIQPSRRRGLHRLIEQKEAEAAWSIPTIDLHKLKMLPAVKLPPTYRLQEDMGNGCSLDPPGYPTYFTRAVYTAHGNGPNKGCQMIIKDDQGLNRCVESTDDWEGKKNWDEYHDAVMERLRKLWKPLPLDHPRTRAWIKAVYAHLNKCYHDESISGNDKTLIFPVPDYRLKSFIDDARFSEEWRQKERISIEQANKEITEHAKSVATPGNHKAVRMIRRFYTGYQPELDLIEHPQKSEGNWWERMDERPSTENCPGQYGTKHPVNGSWCQMCGWHAEES